MGQIKASRRVKLQEIEKRNTGREGFALLPDDRRSPRVLRHNARALVSTAAQLAPRAGWGRGVFTV